MKPVQFDADPDNNQDLTDNNQDLTKCKGPICERVKHVGLVPRPTYQPKVSVFTCLTIL